MRKQLHLEKSKKTRPLLTCKDAASLRGSMPEIARLVCSAIVLSVCCLTALTSHARMGPPPAGAGDRGMLDRDPFAVTSIDRKQRSIFVRAAQKTPLEQLVYADKLEQNKKWRKARRAYDALVRRWHHAPEAPLAQLSVARIRVERGKLMKAFKEYQYAIEHFPGFINYARVVESQFAIANQLRTDLKHGWLGFGREAGPEEVVALFRQIAHNAPSGPRAVECYYFMGLVEMSRKRWDEALVPLESLAVRFPGNELTPSALFHAAHCRVKIFKENHRDEQKLQRALSALTALLRDYPSHPELEQILQWHRHLREQFIEEQFAQAEFYDRNRKNPQAASVAYGEFIKTFVAWPEAAPALEKAEKRLAELSKTHKNHSVGTPQDNL